MGFLDKVKSAADDLYNTANNKIEDEKINTKIRDEERKLDQANKEIGQTVMNCLIDGVPIDESVIRDPVNRALSAMRAINEYKAEKGEAYQDIPEQIYDFSVISGGAQAQPAAQEPASEPATEETYQAPAEPEPVVEEQPAQAEPAEGGNGAWTETDDNGWVEVKEEVFWKEEPAESGETQEPVQPASSQPASTDKVDEPADDSPLSRVQSYNSNNYSGGKL